MDQLTSLEIADVQNRWHEAGRPGLGSLGGNWWDVFNPFMADPEKPKAFTPIPRELSKPEPTDRVAVAPATINTAYLYLPGHDPESVAENKQFVESRKSIFDAIRFPKSLQVGTDESADLMTAYYAALAEQRATGKATPASPAPSPAREQGSGSQSQASAPSWQQYTPWAVVGVLGLTVLIVALRR